jgi:hypothetical protein
LGINKQTLITVIVGNKCGAFSLYKNSCTGERLTVNRIRNLPRYLDILCQSNGTETQKQAGQDRFGFFIIKNF